MISIATRLFLLSILIFSTQRIQAQTQVGSPILGQNPDEFFGLGASISADGNKVAAMGKGKSEVGDSIYHFIRVFELEGEEWSQIGEDIESNFRLSLFSFGAASMAFSANGMRVAIGTPGASILENRGVVEVFEWNGIQWMPIGEPIFGVTAGDWLGISTSFSVDGNRIAIGAFGYGNSAGQVRIYDWNGLSWNLVGTPIFSEAPQELFGISLDLTPDGNRIVIGAPGSFNEDPGRCKVFDWDGTWWTKVGGDILGEGPGDLFGIRVGISNNGNRIIVGASKNDNEAENAGHCRVFDWNSNTWEQLGQDIDGEMYQDQAAYVAISGNGNRIALGSFSNFANGVGSNSGHARIFNLEGNAWVQIGDAINGELHERLGLNVGFSANGERMIVSAHQNENENGMDAGRVLVYSFEPISSTSSPESSQVQLFPNPTTGLVHIQGKRIESVQVLDLNGHVLIEMESPISFVDLTNISTGIYFIKIYCGDQFFVKKMMKL